MLFSDIGVPAKCDPTCAACVSGHCSGLFDLRCAMTDDQVGGCEDVRRELLLHLETWLHKRMRMIARGPAGPLYPKLRSLAKQQQKALPCPLAGDGALLEAHVNSRSATTAAHAHRPCTSSMHTISARALITRQEQARASADGCGPVILEIMMES